MPSSVWICTHSTFGNSARLMVSTAVIFILWSFLPEVTPILAGCQLRTLTAKDARDAREGQRLDRAQRVPRESGPEGILFYRRGLLLPGFPWRPWRPWR